MLRHVVETLLWSRAENSKAFSQHFSAFSAGKDPWMLEFIKVSKIGLVIGDILFLHGGVCTESYGVVPGKEGRCKYVHEWVERLACKSRLVCGKICGKISSLLKEREEVHVCRRMDVVGVFSQEKFREGFVLLVLVSLVLNCLCFVELSLFYDLLRVVAGEKLTGCFLLRQLNAWKEQQVQDRALGVHWNFFSTWEGQKVPPSWRISKC